MQQNMFPTTITKKHRACLSCGILRTNVQFRKDGCPNCPALQLKNNPDNVLDGTSETHRGLIGLVNPEKSWVAKWQRWSNKTSGAYCMIVEGELPDELISRLEESGKEYVPRNQSFTL
ncbi:hypothetical protein EDEG_02857 [Edhazardia aedis USNM 41457]|uniref:Transcription elongation factor SPT4 n=1 Tax=Edhazardia aedis (strain USNM 41457) TaxID=1003232 RepID=J8ZSV7_EDHAE|nr:hypothetical protein EDEG_02857 [Edhazardia aedis USNM 41457]|eukprot:EJW02748.1 hypothetical protein EDEG_02857 [Edhazardia aedis USNM 41457]